ncbi:hypothetical protein [Bathymodiolus platifrons methanotrophic gill symbiont]|uniref:hypothetical protein n=1 Tax=Bathymodiolus platifrons methanotrophic gill symbiont TaxID=113268 RepID=UPI001C8D128A|nr:hypothetical protein [Bathymodiolus platifrons methanotrophic gill symbiont]
MPTTNGSTAIRDKILASLARYRALRIGKFPCAFWRLSAHPGLTAFDSSPLFLARQSVNHKGLIRVNPDASLFLFSAGDIVADARHVNDVLLSWIDSDRRLLVVFPGEIVQNICQNNNYCRGHNDCK